MTIIDHASLLSTDARIIAENETHAVVAVRISKKWIGLNMPFIAALADLTTVLRQKASI